jgi:hypothetical protein
MPDDGFDTRGYLTTMREGAEVDPTTDPTFLLMSDAIDGVCNRWGWTWTVERLDGAALTMCVIGNLVASGVAPADAGAVVANWLAWVVEKRVDDE